MERKASDILVDLEKKVDVLIKLMSTYDLTAKLILKRLNDMQVSGPSVSVDTSKISSPPNQQIQVATNQQQEKINSPQISIDVSKEPAARKRTSDTSKKIPVSQRITDNNGKDLFMADVIIYDENNTVVEKIKTNAVGKWQAHLSAGKYNVHISKIDNTTKKKIESLQEFEVSNEMQTLKLNTAIIRRDLSNAK